MVTLIHLRFPILVFLALSLWAPLAVGISALRSVAANVLLVDNQWQLGVLAFVNGLAIIFSISLMRAVWFRFRRLANARIPKDLSDGRTPGWTEPSMQAWETGHYLIVLATASVTPLVAYYHSANEQVYAQAPFAPNQALMSTLVGIGLSIITMWIFGYVAGLLIGNVRGTANFFPGEDRDQRAWICNLSVYPNRHFDMQMLIYFLLVAGSFFFVLNGLEQRLAWLSVPAYLVILLWLLLMGFTLLSVMLDPLHIPVLIAGLLVVIAVQLAYPRPFYLPQAAASPQSRITPLVKRFVEDSEKSRQAFSAFQQLSNQSPLSADTEASNRHLDRLNAAEDAYRMSEIALAQSKERLDQLAWSAIVARMNKVKPAADKKRTLVIVTCPGGGIHAAAWTAHVLEQLNSLYPQLASSICLISGVSGGSVGTIFFVNSRYIENSCQPNKIERWETAARSSLGAIGAGLAFHDLPALLLPVMQGQDRGIRLEDQWKGRFDKAAQDQTLDAWGQRALAGEMPIVVINATDAASGRRVLFSSIPTPHRPSLAGRVGRPWDYRELIDFQHSDIHVATAARASATFPYVSPLSTPQAASSLGRQVAIGDGGYADNEGIISAIDWLDFIGRQAALEAKAGRPVPFQRILLLRIQPGSDQDGPRDSPVAIQQVATYVRWLAGPLEALASMRATSQVERGQLEADLATTYIDTPWWQTITLPLEETELAQAGQPYTEPNNTEPNNTEPNSAQSITDELASAGPHKDPSGITLPNLQAELYKGNLNIQRRGSELMRLKSKLNSTRGNAFTPPLEQADSQDVNLAPQAYVPTPIAEADEPVVVGILPFIHPEPTREIPLNWRLSPRQLQWYPLAWDQLMQAAAKSELDEEKNVFQLLKSYFAEPAN